MSEPEPNICGGAHGSCTKCIAWIQIVLNTIAGIITITELFDESNTRRTLDFTDYQLSFIWFLIISLVIVLIPNVLFGIILLWGSLKRSARYLRCWIAHAISLVIFLILCTIMGLRPITAVVIVVSWFVYGIWVVRKFKAEILSHELDLERSLHRTHVHLPPSRH